MNRSTQFLLGSIGLVGIGTIAFSMSARHEPSKTIADGKESSSSAPSVASVATNPSRSASPMQVGASPTELTPGVSLVVDPKLNETVRIRTGSLLVSMHPNANEDRLTQLATTHSFSIQRNLGSNTYLVSAPNDRLVALQRTLQADESVAAAEYDYLVRLAGVQTNDPLVRAQSALNALAIDGAWKTSRGDGVTIAIVDTGVDLEHEDLAANVVSGYDFIEDDDVPQDEHGHGTACAGIAAARAMNGVGIAGVAPAARIMPIRVLDETGLGSYSDVAEGIAWAAEHGAKVINVSLGGYAPSTYLADSVKKAQELGALIVASAGNDALTRVTYPAALAGVLSVGAIDEDGSAMPYSNAGKVDLVAAGSGVLTTSLKRGYAGISGTSSAAPIVSGVAALVLGSSPKLDPTTLAHRLTESADAAGHSDLRTVYGAGRVNALRALGGLSQDVAISRLDLSPFPTIGEPTPVKVLVQNRGRKPADAVVNLSVRGNAADHITLQNLAPGEIRTAALNASFSVAAEQEIVTWLNDNDDEVSNNRMKKHVVPVEQGANPVFDLAVERVQLTRPILTDSDETTQIIVSVRSLAGSAPVTSEMRCTAQPERRSGDGNLTNTGAATLIASAQLAVQPHELRQVAIPWRSASTGDNAFAIRCALSADRNQFNDEQVIHVATSSAGEVRAYFGGNAHHQAMRQGVEWLRLQDPRVQSGQDARGVLATIDNFGYKSVFENNSTCEDGTSATGCLYTDDATLNSMRPGSIPWRDAKVISVFDSYQATMDHFWDSDDDPEGNGSIQWHDCVDGIPFWPFEWCPGGTIGNAKKKAAILFTIATEYYERYAQTNDPAERTKAFGFLARVIHLTQDMGVPAHALNDMHPDFSAYHDPDYFDNTLMESQSSAFVADLGWLNPDQSFKRNFVVDFEAGMLDSYSANQCLHRVMFMNNQAAQMFGTNDVGAKPGVPSYYSDFSQSSLTPAGTFDYAAMANTLYPQVIRSTASVLRIFERFVMLPRDWDLDGVPNNFDNCPLAYNPNQEPLCVAILMSAQSPLL